MRRVLLAVLLLVSPWAGCLDGFDSTAITEPAVPDGTLATYEVTADGTTSTETFVAAPDGEPGVSFWLHNGTRANLSSPILNLDETLNPRGFEWDGFLEFPLEAGSEHQARVGGEEATVSLESTTYTVGGESVDAIRAVAEAEDGRQLADATVLAGPTIFAEIEFDTPVDGSQSWTLTGLDHQEGWNEAPEWTVGDWWRVDAETQGRSAETTLVFEGNETSRQGTERRVLNPQEVSARPATYPLHTFRDRDVAPQSGFLTATLSGFWKWPMTDGATVTGNSDLAPQDSYVAEVTREVRTVADRVTTVYTIEAHLHGASDETPFASWGYAPAAEFVTHLYVEDPETGDVRFDWELLDWGSGFHGEMEVPQRQPVFDQQLVEGPNETTERFEAPAETERMQMVGTMVRNEENATDPEVELSLTSPDGTVAWTKNASPIEEDQVHRFNDAIDGTPGNWTLDLHLGENVSLLLEVRAVWLETETVDYR